MSVCVDVYHCADVTCFKPLMGDGRRQYNPLEFSDHVGCSESFGEESRCYEHGRDLSGVGVGRLASP